MMGYNLAPQHHPNSQIQMHNPHPQNPHLEVGSNSSSSSSTLLVRHLPEAIPHETLSRLFSHYGASSVRPCAGGKLRNCAFVDFTNESLASQAHSQLNRLRFLGKVLIVEKANRSSPKQTEIHSSTSLPPSLTKDVGNHTKKSTDPASSATAIGPPVGEPIAKNLGVDYPFPPHLEYAYPPPDGNILTNIVNALIAVPRFYTQVLHLMNKMNIPAPFRMALPTPPLPISTPAPAPPPPPPQPQPPMISAKPHLADISSDESEMESSEEGEDGESHPRKRARREAIVGPAVDKDVAPETVGLRHSTLVPKEMPVIKKKNPVLQIKIAPKSSHNAFTDDVGGKKEMEPPPDLESKLCATPEEIERGKLPPEELLSLPMFKNYTAGNPGTVLYIKNLAKDAVVEDFYFIFGSFFSSVEEAKSSLSVKLMQEGRMRGQAFVTFPSVDLSHRALNLVNGYVFKGKPMIIQFGRNPAAGKAN